MLPIVQAVDDKCFTVQYLRYIFSEMLSLFRLCTTNVLLFSIYDTYFLKGCHCSGCVRQMFHCSVFTVRYIFSEMLPIVQAVYDKCFTVQYLRYIFSEMLPIVQAVDDKCFTVQ